MRPHLRDIYGRSGESVRFQVGGRTILEYWIPAGELDDLNDNIVGLIQEVAVFH